MRSRMSARSVVVRQVASIADSVPANCCAGLKEAKDLGRRVCLQVTPASGEVVRSWMSMGW